MNLLTLRHDLAKKLEEVCKDFVLKKPLSEESSDFIESSISIFEQKLPPARMNESSIYHPLIIVRASGGNVDDEYKELGNITLVIETWDDDEYHSGEDDLLSIIERIKNHFLAHPILSKKFYCQKEMSYDLAEEQPAPYWCATLTMTWELPKTNIMTGADYV